MPAPAPLPRLSRRDDAVYLVVPDTPTRPAIWRVHWVCFGPPLARPFKRKRLGWRDPRANYVWFVRADGAERCYLLSRATTRPQTAADFAAALERAGEPAPMWEFPKNQSGVLGG